ncbi:ABC transporter permease [Methanobrevibacter sp. DSM 116169]|uniref:ABC transporter permease n=1 Tax=Methanobrevibacter sp. DSM 116169 TaxID=3242727 RepID=UPI0038FBE8ED
MKFLKFIIKNPFRDKTRAILSIFSIAITISLIISLGAITDGLVHTVDETLNTGNSDFMIMNKNSTSNIIDDSLIDNINKAEGIANIIGISEIKIPIKENNNLYLYGSNINDLNDLNFKIIEGKMFDSNQNEIIIGKLCSNSKNLKINDNIKINNISYKITGIFESGTLLDSYGFTSFNNLETITNSTNNNATMLFVKVNDVNNLEQITNEIDSEYGDKITIITTINDISSVNTIYNMFLGAKLGITLLVLLVGAISIVNTMLSNVYERTREIGVLKAVGWSNKKILIMVIGESVVLTLIGALIGSILGVILVEFIYRLGIIAEIVPYYTAESFLLAILVSIIVGIIGGIFPARRATKIPVTESLRHE